MESQVSQSTDKNEQKEDVDPMRNIDRKILDLMRHKVDDLAFKNRQNKGTLFVSQVTNNS